MIACSYFFGKVCLKSAGSFYERSERLLRSVETGAVCELQPIERSGRCATQGVAPAPRPDPSNRALGHSNGRKRLTSLMVDTREGGLSFVRNVHEARFEVGSIRSASCFDDEVSHSGGAMWPILSGGKCAYHWSEEKKRGGLSARTPFRLHGVGLFFVISVTRNMPYSTQISLMMAGPGQDAPIDMRGDDDGDGISPDRRWRDGARPAVQRRGGWEIRREPERLAPTRRRVRSGMLGAESEI